MMAASRILGTALAICTIGIAAAFSPTAYAQGMIGVPLPNTTKAPANAKPTITGNPSRMLVAGSFYDFRPSASDPDSAKLSFAINKKPRWANFDANTGRLYGTPSSIDVGRIKGIQISVSDGVNRKGLTKFGIKVVPGAPPMISGTPPTAATEGAAYDFQPSASDPDQQPLQFAIVNRPSWAKFDPATGRLSGTPTVGSAGSYAGIGISVTDGATTVSLPAFTINVGERPNTAPKISGVPGNLVQVGQSYDFVPSATDVDGDALTFSSVNVPTWLSFDKATGRLYGKPQSGQEDTYSGIVISVTDGRAVAFIGPFSITVSAAPASKTPVPNSAPVISGTPATRVDAGKAYVFQPTATDADGDALTFGAGNVPNWLVFDTATGRLSGTAPSGSTATYSGIVISVTDGTSTSSLPPFSITVTAAPVNAPPTIGGTAASRATVGEAYSFAPVASDADGDALTFVVSGKPSWLGFDASTGRLSGTPSASDVGVHTGISVSVSDGKATASLQSFSITVANPPNTPPVIAGAPATSVTVGQAYAFQPTASDADGNVLRFGVANKPQWLAFDVNTGRLSGTPTDAHVGTASGIVISVSDGTDSATLPPFSITVAARPNSPPTISGSPATTVTEGVAYGFQPSASDADGDALTFSVSGKPAWLVFNSSTGSLSGTAPVGSAGSVGPIVVSVSDGKVSAALPGFTITVTAKPNRAPTISGSPATGASVGQAYAFQPVASDPDGDVVRFGVANKPQWLAFDVNTGRLSGTPTDAHVGTASGIVISVSDGTDSATLPPFSITVAARPNSPPIISGSPFTGASEGVAYSFQPSASDADGDTLTFSVSGKPAWLGFNGSTGRLSGTPPAGSAGNFGPIVVAVSDGKASAALPGFTITVSAKPNSVPTISGSPAIAATEGVAYGFQPAAADADGDVLTFSVSGKPAWLAFNSSNGSLSGTPPADSAGSFGPIVITVSDGKASASLPAFTITVTAKPNTPPTITGAPATSVTVGQAYSFQPVAKDPDGQVLRFGIANKPTWANFDIVTGRLSGTPGDANVGSTANIVISVSDGALSATLPAFTLTVAKPVIGSAELSWTAPTQNEDGSALTNLAGYKVRYGTSPGALTKVLDVVGAGINSAVIEGLAAGTWYFSISSYTNTGVESAPTGTVYKTIQ